MNHVDIVMDMLIGQDKGVETEQVVYTTPNGKTYHREDCATLTQSATIITLSEKEAKEQGKRPCSLCLNPP